LQLRANGDPNKDEIGERNNPNMSTWYGVARRGSRSSYGPTEMHRENLSRAKTEFASISQALAQIVSTIDGLESKLIQMGAPYIEGQPLRGIGEK